MRNCLFAVFWTVILIAAVSCSSASRRDTLIRIDSLYARSNDSINAILPQSRSQCRENAKKGIELCDKFNMPILYKIDLLNVMGESYMADARNSEAMQYFGSAAGLTDSCLLLEEPENPSPLAKRSISINSYLAFIVARTGNYDAAIDYTNKALEKFSYLNASERIDLKEAQVTLRANKGYYLFKKNVLFAGDMEEEAAWDEFRSLKIADNKRLESNISNNRAMICRVLTAPSRNDRCEQFITNAKRSATTPEDSANALLNEAMYLRPINADSAKAIAGVANRLLAFQRGDKRTLMDLHTLLAKLYKDLNEKDSALKELEDVVKVEQELYNSETPRQIQSMVADIEHVRKSLEWQKIVREEEWKRFILLSLAALTIAVLTAGVYLLAVTRPSTKWLRTFALVAVVFFIESIMSIAHFLLEKNLPHSAYQPLLLLAVLGSIALVLHPGYEAFSRYLEHVDMHRKNRPVRRQTLTSSSLE